MSESYTSKIEARVLNAKMSNIFVKMIFYSKFTNAIQKPFRLIKFNQHVYQLKEIEKFEDFE